MDKPPKNDIMSVGNEQCQTRTGQTDCACTKRAEVFGFDRANVAVHL